ncbi:immunoglobulin superfamily member 5 isoform X1 [Salvelinus fontinalis]|uniref:immunoglobulin superfamily member 5 isoform X1 n=1 Tax=Salvelinus fontinalis TaxID=8038 RepID=UPI00248518AE|nr:immunoglobulin superfamily member 5 isoform X1 [Salvelinus fontinalis]
MASVFFTLLLLYATGVSGVPQLEPLNVTVLRGSEARFNISLSEEWYSMSWMLKTVLVLTINSGTGVSEHNRRFAVTNYSSADIYCWEFIIRDVWRNDTGDVSCGVQEKPTQTAQLFVQESGTVRIVGGNMTVAQGHQAIFRCEASGWFPKPTVSWVVDGVVVDQNSYNSSSEALDGLYNSISLLTVRGVNSVQVKCLASVSALTTPLSSSFYLVVEPHDWTVLIAVVCSIGGFALLVLLILGIVFCCKRRKEAKSSYQKEMGRTGSQIQMSGGAVGQKQGKENPAYVIDGQTTGVTHSEFNDSGYIQTNYTKHFEIPDLVNGNQAANGHASAYNILGGTGVRKHRHVTIV